MSSTKTFAINPKFGIYWKNLNILSHCSMTKKTEPLTVVYWLKGRAMQIEVASVLSSYNGLPIYATRADRPPSGQGKPLLTVSWPVGRITNRRKSLAWHFSDVTGDDPILWCLCKNSMVKTTSIIEFLPSCQSLAGDSMMSLLVCTGNYIAKMLGYTSLFPVSVPRSCFPRCTWQSYIPHTVTAAILLISIERTTFNGKRNKILILCWKSILHHLIEQHKIIYSL